MDSIQTWELWFPDAGATGLLVGRSSVDAQSSVWVHAAPPRLSVIVRDGDERVVARGDSLERKADSLPMTRLVIADGEVTREDRFPTDGDLGDVVLLAGGEAGILRAWWNAGDGSEWRWSVEFHNRR